jgi:hypothetical protein
MTEEASCEIVDAVTEAMREADKMFETIGGSTRHYVRDLLLPILQEKGYEVIKTQPTNP